MTRAILKVDQWLHIGRDIHVSPTDIDAAGVRLLARGRVLGGANDGATFEAAHEMTVGSSVHLGPHVAITLVKLKDDAARFDVFAPTNVLVQSE